MKSIGSVKDLLAGLIFIGIGLAFGYGALGYDIGSGLRMGPGYFPLLLAGILVFLGIVITLQGAAAEAQPTRLGRVPFMGLVLIMGALVFFGVTVQGLGLVPALFITTTLSAFASQKTGVIGAIVLGAALTVLSYVIFVWALGLPLRAVGPWLQF